MSDLDKELEDILYSLRGISKGESKEADWTTESAIRAIKKTIAMHVIGEDEPKEDDLIYGDYYTGRNAMRQHQRQSLWSKD